MKNMLFIYKDEGRNNRDVVNYINRDIGRFTLGHYFSTLNLEGSCFSKSYDIDEIGFDNITSILDEEEFRQLSEFGKSISSLGSGIEEGSDRYMEGLALVEGIQHIIDKLESEENEGLFKQVVEDEIKILMQDHNLDKKDIEDIFHNYPLDYKDRSIVGGVYGCTRELGEEYAFSTGLLEGVSALVGEFFDYEAFGEYLTESEEEYLVLDDGRIVQYMF